MTVRNYERFLYGWTIFRPHHPFNRHWLVREWVNAEEAIDDASWIRIWLIDMWTVARSYGCLCDSLEEAREQLPRGGLYCIGREPLDHPAIVESWV